MKTQLKLLFICQLLFAICCSTRAQGNAFTYQGRLNSSGAPANGIYDLRFTIYNSTNIPGTLIAGPITNSSVGVSNGLFTVALDFGAAVFDGTPYWLEIGVRPVAGGGTFTTLAPRQAITPAPYAMFATTAGTVPNGAITAAQLAAGAAAANLQAGGQSAVAGGGVVLSEQSDATELINAGYTKIGRANLIDEAWLARAAGPTNLPAPLARQGHTAVWTGSEMIIWGGYDDISELYTGARYNPVAGTWTRLSTTNAPYPRSGHTAVWTGTEMIVAGGITNAGGRYNPATDTWTAIPPGGYPSGNRFAFWTGSEMLTWGTSSGERYSPGLNTWTTISSVGAPSYREDCSVVFNGAEMIVWGGRFAYGPVILTHTNLNDGARYNLIANTWTPITLTGAPFRRYGHSAVWSGTEMIVWGGGYKEGSSLAPVSSNYNNGARYNPTANTWSPITATAAPVARYGHSAVWAGNRMVIWGGTDGTNLLQSGSRYFPAANTWSNMTILGRPVERSGHTVVWSGSEMIVWGGFNEIYRDIGGRYHATNDVWTPTPPTGEPSERRGHTALWTGSEVLFWGGFDGERYLNTGGRYLPASNIWLPITTNGAPPGRITHSAVWTGTEMIVWGGVGPNFLNTGGRYNPANNTWAAITTNGAPTARNGHAAVWTGSQMVVWGGLDGSFVNTGGRYNPANNTWTATTTSGAPAVRSGVPSIWTGMEMIVWGGTGGSIISQFALSTGGRYNPVSNSWATLPNTGAPAARTAHRAVWTGDEMLVWGGTDLTTELNTGGRYHRASNTWYTVTTNGAPSPRTSHTAVWDGTRMIVWGGSDPIYLFADTGGIYNPLTDTWQPTLANSNAPPARALHAAVWAGSEMVIHGGYNADFSGTHFLNDTWRYTPPRTMFLYLKP